MLFSINYYIHILKKPITIIILYYKYFIIILQLLLNYNRLYLNFFYSLLIIFINFSKFSFSSLSSLSCKIFLLISFSIIFSDNLLLFNAKRIFFRKIMNNISISIIAPNKLKRIIKVVFVSLITFNSRILYIISKGISESITIAIIAILYCPSFKSISICVLFIIDLLDNIKNN